ncbi:MAG: DUF4097 family beta strand repeat-containing protein [Mobilitalea sp.]
MKTFIKVWLSIGLIAIGVGIALLIIAASTGATWRDIPTYSLEENYKDIVRLDMEIGYGDVKIVEGNEFSIDAENLPEDGLDSYVEDGTWFIREDYDNDLNIFGSNFSIRQILTWNDVFTPKITITIPEGFVAEDISFSIGAGNVEADTINAKSGDFTVKAGRLKINQLTIDGKSQYNIGTGEMKLTNVDVEDIIVDCGVGYVLLEGTVTGDNDITCGIGSVELNLDGDKADYSYEVSAGIGRVVVDDNSYHDIDSKVIRDNDAENNLNLDCGIGEITVDFN